MNRHLSDDELIARLYGLGEAESHLAACAECGERWNEIQRALGRTRAESARELDERMTASMLLRQRRQILERLDRPSSGSYARRWAPAAAAAAVLLLAIGLFLTRPSSFSQSSLNQSSLEQSSVPAAAAPALNSETDMELFTDVYSMEQDVEPKAAAPIHALFQQASFEPSAKEVRNQ